MKSRHAALRSMIRASLVVALAFGLTIFTGLTSHAGTTPTPTATPATPTSTPTAAPTTPTPTSTPTAAPTTPTPTAAPSTPPPSPTSSPTAPPTATPSAPPTACDVTWGVTSITTIGKSNSPTNNLKVSHLITGNIIDPDSLCPAGETCTAQRIPVCTGTEVIIDITGSTDNTNIGKGNIFCDDGSRCSVGSMIFTEKYLSVSDDGTDSDRITLLPQ